MLIHPPSTIYYSFCGIFSGMFYLHTKTFESLQVPIVITQFCSKYFGPILSLSPTIIDHSSQSLAGIGANNNTNNNNNNQYHPRRATNVFDFDTVQTYYSSPQPPRQPSQQHIDYLISMGVDRERAIQELMRCDDELNMAIESLFPTSV